MIGLSPKQMQLLRFIAGYQAAHGGISPCVRECARGTGQTAKSAAQAMLRQLEERGKIRRLFGRERAIEVLDAPAIPTIAGAPLYAVPLVMRRGNSFSGERL